MPTKRFIMMPAEELELRWIEGLSKRSKKLGGMKAETKVRVKLTKHPDFN
jgi:hypothetical protein